MPPATNAQSGSRNARSSSYNCKRCSHGEISAQNTSGEIAGAETAAVRATPSGPKGSSINDLQHQKLGRKNDRERLSLRSGIPRFLPIKPYPVTQSPYFSPICLFRLNPNQIF